MYLNYENTKRHSGILCHEKEQKLQNNPSGPREFYSHVIKCVGFLKKRENVRSKYYFKKFVFIN